MRIQSEVGSQQAASICVVVMVHFVHVVWGVANLHVYPSVCHGLPLHTFAPGVRWRWRIASNDYRDTHQAAQACCTALCDSKQQITSRHLAWLQCIIWLSRSLKLNCNQRGAAGGNHPTEYVQSVTFSVIQQRYLLIFKAVEGRVGSDCAPWLPLFIYLFFLTSVSVCRWKRLPPPSQSRWPAGPEAQW